MGVHHYNLGLLFEEIATVDRDRVALRLQDKRVSYGTLFDRIEALSELLLASGHVRGDVVALAHDKGALAYGCMLAAIRLGITYVNIDTGSPAARNARILAVSGARTLFCEDGTAIEASRELIGLSGIRVQNLAEADLTKPSPEALAHQHALAAAVDGSCIAYIMFTSGSTGQPKGVAITHQNLLHFIAWGRARFGVTRDDNFANLNPMYFDNSVFDFYVSLFNGASLTPVPRALLNTPGDLVAHIGAMGCTIWFSVPSLLIYLMAMKALTPAAMPALRCFVFGGEGYPKIELVKLHRMYGSRAQLVNVYGPTECTCICSAYDVTAEDFVDLAGLPVLGHLNPNFDYRIVDDADGDAETGELCLIGPNVAAGYFNDPDRSAKAFVTLEEPRRYMKRMYRTGDLVREQDGILSFVGRKDNQIKHMGYRIELEEIERALNSLPDVIQAAVVYQKQGTAYGKILGFVASAIDLEEKALLMALRTLVPDYMLPSRIVIVPDLPKNANGKVDRPNLPSLLQAK